MSSSSIQLVSIKSMMVLREKSKKLTGIFRHSVKCSYRIFTANIIAINVDLLQII